jgi:hypothetical protein
MPIEHRIREAVDTFMARVRHDLEAHSRGLMSDITRLVEEQHDQWRTDTDRAVAEARLEAERSLRSSIATMRTELAHEMEVRLGAERVRLAGEISREIEAKALVERPGATASTSATSKADTRNARVDTLDRLLGAVRRIDEATTLSGVLDVLARGASDETSRVAILLVEGDMLRSWRHFGFAPTQGPLDLVVGEVGVLAAAVALKQTSFVPPLPSFRDSGMPEFMRVPSGHTGLVVPIIVGYEVVAVLYADDVGRREEQEDAPVWTEEIDLLVRHAALRLDNLTSAKTVEVLNQ